MTILSNSKKASTNINSSSGSQTQQTSNATLATAPSNNSTSASASLPSSSSSSLEQTNSSSQSLGSQQQICTTISNSSTSTNSLTILQVPTNNATNNLIQANENSKTSCSQLSPTSLDLLGAGAATVGTSVKRCSSSNVTTSATLPCIASSSSSNEIIDAKDLSNSPKPPTVEVKILLFLY